MTLRGPRQLTPYPDRDLDCQQALESTFNQVIHLAEQCGWDVTEATEALRELSFARLAMEEENMRTTLAIIAIGMTKH